MFVYKDQHRSNDWHFIYSFQYNLMKMLVNNENSRFHGGFRWKMEYKATEEGNVMQKHI